ncbi:hypothetical protein CALCODRAFT_486561 [Calocera cornea HHB12733]|uniref:Uncharacterized protein n=1 Tax=Calocera cornea HHB12733 TaxID=1353952 RepID=A0A165DNL9_9BASI|nr:hypothetical protein CALCODRAFT_486561 [Calocera cornea HHB12733]
MANNENATSNATEQPLALPSTSDAAEQSLEVGGTLYRFDALGPMITLSRIANWQELTQPERERTVRVLGRRNQ